MCTVCSATQGFNPDNHTGNGPVFATVVEGLDAPQNPPSTYVLNSGDTFLGTLSTGTDYDVIGLNVVAGQSYEIAMSGQTLNDPYLYLYSTGSGGPIVNDDGGPGLDASIIFTAQTTGTIYVSAETANELSDSGSYAVSFAQSSAPQPSGSTGTLDELANYLTNGFWNGNSRRWDTSSDNIITVNLNGLDAAGRQLARWAFETWEMVADIEFREQSFGTANITFVDDDPSGGAFASSSVNSNGFITSSYINIDRGWLSDGASLDAYSFSTYVHEIGHALGLGHQGGYNGSASYPTDATFLNDSYQMSVMSYFSQTQNSSVSASYALPLTAMMSDIVAIQNLYGAAGSGSATDGDTTFGANGTLGNYVDTFFNELASGSPNRAITQGGPVTLTIFDVGGIDTINIAFLNDSNRLDLRDERFSDVGGLIGNVGIARGTVIENALLGSGNDTVTGNAAANDINLGDGMNVAYGLAGDDTLTGGAQSDELNGGDDNDSLVGGGANDALYGGRGNDTAQGGEGQDTLGGFDGDDSLDGGAGNDEVWGANGNDTLLGGDGNDTLGATGGNDSAEGGAGDDAVWGAFGNDTLLGDAGEDTLGGYYGNDSLDGGADDDEIWGAWGEDTLLGGTGNDQLGAGDQNDLLEGQDGNDTLSGGRGDDTINGGTGNDTIYGYTGADIITGGAGNDVIYGGTGADEFIFAAGFGDDTIFGFSTVDGLTFDDALWSGTLTEAQIVATFADDSTGTVIFDFGTGAMLTLAGVSSTVGLAATIDII